jgi:hypothetical protein
MKRLPLLLGLFLGVDFWPARLSAAPLDELDRYNVVWSTPSRDASGSMPIGNGEVGLNLWVEADGDLLFYISRTDAWSEASRLLKLGRIRVSLTPNPFAKGAPFRQELKLRDGCIEITAGEAGRALRLTVFVEANAPVIHLLGKSEQRFAVKVALENWRTERKVLKGEELSSSWTMQSAPSDIEVGESADVVKESPPDAVVWYHRNEHSVVPVTLKHQSLETAARWVKDPLLHRTFGGRISAPGFTKEGRTALRSSAPVLAFSVQIATANSQTETAEGWEREMARTAGEARDSTAAASSTAKWWQAFWERSWIFVEGDQAANLPESTHPLRIGADSNGGNIFAGLVSRASLYDHALSEADVQALAASGAGGAISNATGLVARWRFKASENGKIAGTQTGDLLAKPVRTVSFTNDGGVEAASLGGGWFEVANEPRLKLSKAFTLEAWIKPRPGAGAGRLFDKITAGGSDGFLLDTHPGRDLRLIVGSDTLSTPNVLIPGVWQHVAAVVDAQSGLRRIYLDGKTVKGVGGGGDEALPPSRVTQAYVLQRWMAACAGRGNYPIKFNGSIFTVDPVFTGGPKFNADWRRWGDCFWWQNTRFPAYAAIMAGDYDQCAPIFRLFSEVLPICKARATLYYEAQGAYFPETMTLFGTYANNDYGWNRQGHKPGDVLCPYWAYAWQQGLELVMLMQDYFEHTGDTRFLAGELIPMAHEVLRYFDTRFARDTEGKLVISPAQAVETYWYGVTNDTPTVAGLNAVLDQLLALPAAQAPAAEREFWTKMKAATPLLPGRSENGKSFVTPAQKFKPQRSNCENPELYAIWPFRLFGPGKPGRETGVETFRRRGEKGMSGWSYDAQCAAILGLTDEAKRQILHKVRNSNPAHRFPAMWGPNFDWLPDQDHGSNILLTLQHMLLFADGEKINLLPAWPADWNVRFKLHAPRQTTVEAEFHGRTLVNLKVEPPARKADVIVCPVLP